MNAAEPDEELVTRLQHFVAASDGASAELLERAAALPIPQDAPALIAALGLACREGRSIDPFVEPLEDSFDKEAATLLRLGRDLELRADPKQADELLRTLSFNARPFGYVLGSIVFGDAAPRYWRHFAQTMLFALDRPYFKVSEVPAAPDPGSSAEESPSTRRNEPADGQPDVRARPDLVGGEPAGFIITFENGFKVYHMGDPGLFGDMAFIGSYYEPDLVLMPIGGHYVTSPKDAAYATTKYLKPKHVIPMHFGTNPLLKGTVAEFKDALSAAKKKVVDTQPGETKAF